MTRALLAAALLAAIGTPALAGDSRLVERLYDPNEVVRVEGKAGKSTIEWTELNKDKVPK